MENDNEKLIARPETRQLALEALTDHLREHERYGGDSKLKKILHGGYGPYAYSKKQWVADQVRRIKIIQELNE